MAVAACWERDPAAGEEWHELLPGGSLRAPYLAQRVWAEQFCVLVRLGPGTPVRRVFGQLSQVFPDTE
jgi:hypothetical protein